MTLRLALIALLALLACSGASRAASPAAVSDELVFLTWADYIDPEVVAQFEKEQGVRVRFAYFESDDGRDELLTNDDARGYDLTVVNGVMLDTYARRGWLARVPAESIGNLRHLDPRWTSAFASSERYGVPYFWGTLGIAFRRDLVPEEITSWQQFFTPEGALRGRISLLRNSRDVIGMAMKALGHSPNSNDREAIRAAGELLEAQRPFVRTYEYVSLGEESALVSGEVWASMMYSGDALMIREHDENIAYVIPREGSNLWVDYLAILQSSPRQALAAQFIDFLNRPQIAARNAEFVYYASPNTAAREFQSVDYLADPIIHPSDDALGRSDTYQTLAPRSQKTLNSVFAQLLR